MNGAGAAPPWRLQGGGGITAVVVDGGGLASLAAGEVELVQHPASAFEAGLAQLWVRDRTTGAAWPVLGPGTGGTVQVRDGALVVAGTGGGLRWRAVLALHPVRRAWAWHVEVGWGGPGPREVDVVHAHDVALALPGVLRANELYVSQYLDVTPLEGAWGTALAVRQNLPQAGRHPWCVLAADGPAVAWATDALDVHGLAARGAGARAPLDDLPSRRRQHEHTLGALQTAGLILEAGGLLRVSFAGLVVEDHPPATGPADAALVEAALELAGETAPWATGRGPGATADGATGHAPARTGPSGPYDPGREAPTRALGEADLRRRWPEPWRAVERDEHGVVLSFFAGDAHVVTQDKERGVLRPHGTILRSGAGLAPDPEGLAVTAWMTGSPLSYLTRGHATRGRVLTTVRGYLGLHRAYGLRVLVDVAGTWRLLDLPSAFATTPQGAHWVYVLDGVDAAVVEVRTVLARDARRASVAVTTSGPPRRVLLALHAATPEEPLPATASADTAEATDDGVVVRTAVDDAAPLLLHVRTSAPVTLADDGALFDDGVARAPAVITLATGPVTALELDLTVSAEGRPEAGDPAPDEAAADLPGPAVRHPEADALDVALPWLVHDALVHYLSPRGLEQYTGGAWGTRDVAQGPLELLLALDREADARDLVLRIFAAQNPDGSWPQAFGFLPGDEGFRHEPPHGDVVHWPVVALGRYLLASGDVAVLDEPVGWFGGDAPTPLLEHVDRALACARGGALPGTALVAYGHGDWNDSLQPADPEMTLTMVSTWTVILHRQALRALAEGLAAAGALPDRVAALRAEADAVTADLRRHLLVDGELAGYARFDPAGSGVTSYLVHPRDAGTGLRHGALPIIHALADDLLDPAEAAHHVAVVRDHLTGVDGVRLFDRPPGYHGGETRHFQRAETATFVGREIGLMYVHAHLRWCEALARLGAADELWHAVRQCLAAGVVDVVPGARRRQANAYASSSDAAVLDRAEFAARYDDVLSGATGLEGGWRIYSSGPGVLVRVVTQSMLGIRRREAWVEIDPVLAPRLDGLAASVPLAGGLLRVRYHVGPAGHGVASVRVDGQTVDARPLVNPYRAAGVRVRLGDLAPALAPDGPELEVDLS